MCIAATWQNFLKTHAFSSKYAKAKSPPEEKEEEEILPFEPPALRKHVPYAPTQLRLARSLARTTRTRNETETDFPVGVDRIDYSPQPPINDVWEALQGGYRPNVGGSDGGRGDRRRAHSS